jgi:putative endonuclease
MGKTYQVYVLRNWAGKYYIGLSENPDARLGQHNAGVSRWTRGRGPWEVFWASEWMGLGQARKLENLLKRQKHGSGLYRRLGRAKPSGS